MRFAHTGLRGVQVCLRSGQFFVRHFHAALGALGDCLRGCDLGSCRTGGHGHAGTSGKDGGLSLCEVRLGTLDCDLIIPRIELSQDGTGTNVLVLLHVH